MTTINDIHSRLNETDVARVMPVDSVQAIRSALATTGAERLPVSVAGGGTTAVTSSLGRR